MEIGNPNRARRSSTMGTRKIVNIGGKIYPFPELHADKPAPSSPAPIPEIVAGYLESVATTEEFLNQLKQVGSYAYRKKIHLSDVELANLLNENITAQLRVVRDYYLIWTFIHLDPKTAAKWEAFWKECNAEIQNIIAGEVE